MVEAQFFLLCPGTQRSWEETYIPVMFRRTNCLDRQGSHTNGEYFFRVKAVNKIGGGEYIELKIQSLLKIQSVSLR